MIIQVMLAALMQSTGARELIRFSEADTIDCD